MKKIITLLAAAGMVVAASAPASAVDVKVDYRHRISFTSSSENFTGQNLEQAKNRVRLGLTLAASENLKGYTQFQLLHNKQFGEIGSTHGDNDITVRQMYIDWTVPTTAVKVRMGRMEMGLPVDAFGENAVMAAGYGSRDGVVVTAPVTDWLSLTALWNRTNYGAWNNGEDPEGTKFKSAHDLDNNSSDDIYALVANMKFNGVSGSVYAAYATLDKDFLTYKKTTSSHNPSNGSTLPTFEGNAYWLGFTSTISMFDPFVLKLSAAYGEASDSNGADFGQKGWNVQAKASYKMDFGTPVFGAWYFSGDDKDENVKGSMPTVTGAFTPIRMYHDAGKGLNVLTGHETPVGNWGVQLGIEKVSFLKDLSHDFFVSYVAGTNDQELVKDQKKTNYLGDEDAFVAFTLTNTYQIYKNLAAHLEMIYIVNEFETADRPAMTEDDWGVELTFEYKF